MQDNKKTPRKRRKVTVFRVIVVLLLVAGCAFAIYRLRMRSKLNARIEAIREAGYPVTLTELDEWYSIPDDADNAAYTITDAFSYYVKAQDDKLLPLPGRAGLPPRNEPLTEETKAVVIKYITDNRKALELLHAGAAIGNCRYPVDLSVGSEALFHDLSSLKKGARLLSVEALSHANGDPNLAARSIISAFGLARSLENEPTLVSQLVRIACQGLAESTLEQIVNRADFTDEQLGFLSEAVHDARAPSAMSRAFAGERCMYLTTFKRSPKEIGRLISDEHDSVLEANLTNLAFTLYRWAGLTDRSTIIYLDLMEGYIEATQQPLDRRREVIDAIEAKCDAVSRDDFLLGRIMPAIARVAEIELRSIAGLHVAQAALAIQRYRRAEGRLPDVLGDLMPDYLDAVPIDPFDGEQLRYNKLEVGFVVYSIGEDLSDDGGKERFPAGEKKRRPHECDITFIVER